MEEVMRVQQQWWTERKEVKIMKKKNHMDEEGHMRERETEWKRDIQPERGRERGSWGCRVHRRYGNERRERGKEAKWGEKRKTSDAKRRWGGQMREGSCRAGKGCEARERANAGLCFTNCHFRGANSGTRGKKYNYRLAPDWTQREMYWDTSKHCIMHTWMNTHTHILTQTQMFQIQVERRHRYTWARFDG